MKASKYSVKELLNGSFAVVYDNGFVFVGDRFEIINRFATEKEAMGYLKDIIENNTFKD